MNRRPSRLLAAAALVTLGFCLNAQPTVAQKHEEMAILCARYKERVLPRQRQAEKDQLAASAEARLVAEAIAKTLRPMSALFCGETLY